MRTVLLFILLSAFVIACQDSSNSDSSRSRTNEGRDQKTAGFVITKEDVRKAFLEYLPTVAEDRVLNESWETPDGKGYRILLGDINGDGREDAVVDYSLEPNAADNGGGGNAVPEIPGLIAYINTGDKFVFADNSTDFISRNLTSISDGVIKLEGLDYGPDDPRCCPSVKKETKVVLRNNRLVEIQ